MAWTSEQDIMSDLQALSNIKGSEEVHGITLGRGKSYCSPRRENFGMRQKFRESPVDLTDEEVASASSSASSDNEDSGSEYIVGGRGQLLDHIRRTCGRVGRHRVIEQQLRSTFGSSNFSNERIERRFKNSVVIDKDQFSDDGATSSSVRSCVKSSPCNSDAQSVASLDLDSEGTKQSTPSFDLYPKGEKQSYFGQESGEISGPLFTDNDFPALS